MLDPSAAPRNIRIVSDGTSVGTKIVDAKNGEPIPGYIENISWDLGLAGPAMAIVTFVQPEIDVVGEGYAVEGQETKPMKDENDDESETKEKPKPQTRERFG